MFRVQTKRLTAIVDTCVPSNFVYSTDLAFYFPRFQPNQHLPTHGIPELTDAIALLQPKETLNLTKRWSRPVSKELEEWKKNRDLALTLLSRGEEIMENVGGVSNASTSDVLRALLATKFELLNGIEHLPKSNYVQRLDVYRVILKQSGRLLFFNDTWDKTSVKQLDTSCVILGHFIRAFCALNQRPFHIEQNNQGGISKISSHKNKNKNITSNLQKWSMIIDDTRNGNNILTLQIVMERIDEFLELSRKVSEKNNITDSFSDIRWNVPKLLLLKGILTIPLTGNLEHARGHIEEAAKIVYEFQPRKQPIIDGLVARKQEPELGLFMLAQAEISARMFDWSLDANEVDNNILQMFESAAKFYSSPFNNSLDPDGIMSSEKIEERRFEVDAYTSCILSYATFLLNAPRLPGKTARDSPVFLPKQIFTTSPILTVATSSNIIFSDVQEPVKMSLDVIRKKTGESLERALQLNRTLFPEYKTNVKAGWILLAMACLYADMRDYLYATGLFASAEKAIVENYGNTSPEHLLTLKLRYEFLAGVGSEQEAKTAAHEVVQLLKKIDVISKG